MNLREAARNDAPALARLNAQLGYPATEDEIERRIMAISDAPDAWLIVAEIGGEVVGSVQVVAKVNMESGLFGEILSMIVDDQFRGKGIGRALIERAVDICRERGCPKVRVRSNVVRDDAHAFYRALGFSETKRQAVFDLPLEP